MFHFHSPHTDASQALSSSLVIRPAADADVRALEVLAQLDAARVPAGPTLVAEVGGEVVAAYGVDRGERIGDPFRPTAELLDLLLYRALQRGPMGRAA